jgi:2-polyprenyl-6-methoxyphenol hydroxylase-like FAD-dependent oxidoreductase
MTSSQPSFGHAVVIGGSIAGLLSARVLSDHFHKVTLLERDPRPDSADPRKGIPQGRHLHVVMEAGLKVLEDLFPGVTKEMQAEGADLSDAGRDTAWHHYGAWKPRYVSGIETILCTRPYLEWKVRGRIATLPNVEVRHECTVTELLTEEARTQVTGVRLEGPEGAASLSASLVVDASGRGSRAPRWLESLGYGRPEEEQVSIDLAYTSRLYERPAQVPGDWKVLGVYSRPPATRSALMCNVEGGRWMVSLSGYFGDHPPTDEQGFLDFARSLPAPHVYHTLRNARPVTPPVMHKIPSSRWLHYERMPRLPEGLLLLGDTVCALNPVYGQGMTVISQAAQLLARQLTTQARTSPGHLRGLSRRFQKQLATLLFTPWLMSTTMDLRFPQAQGKRYPGLGLVHWTFGNMLDLTSQDAKACHQFFEVLHMRKGTEALLQPDFLRAFARYGLKSLTLPLAQRANVGPMPPAP